MDVADGGLVDAHAAGDDHLAVAVHRFADGFKRFRLGGVDKPAGIDDHRIRRLVGRHHLIAFGAQLGKDAF